MPTRQSAPGPEDANECVVLSRVIQWTQDGVEYEVDPGQVEKLVAECGMAETNSVATPSVRQARVHKHNGVTDPGQHTRPAFLSEALAAAMGGGCGRQQQTTKHKGALGA